MNPSTINHKPSTRRWIPLLLIVGGIAAFVVYARTRPALELYTTPPLDSKGTKIQLLIPRRWCLTMGPDVLRNIASLQIEDPGSAPFLPEWARRSLHMMPERGYIGIGWTNVTGSPNVGDSEVVMRMQHVAKRCHVIRDCGIWWVDYSQDSPSLFNSQHRAILDSVKVL